VFSHSATFSITFPELNQRFHEIFRLPSFELLAARMEFKHRSLANLHKQAGEF